MRSKASVLFVCTPRILPLALAADSKRWTVDDPEHNRGFPSSPKQPRFFASFKMTGH
jgi:predicted deacylase